MVFTTTNLFKGIPCPAVQSTGHCSLTHCIFSHEEPNALAQTTTLRASTPGTAPSQGIHDPRFSLTGEPAPKKRRTEIQSDVPRRSITTEQPRLLVQSNGKESRPLAAPTASVVHSDLQSKTPSTLQKPVSPPPRSARYSTVDTSITSIERRIPPLIYGSTNSGNVVKQTGLKRETLNPRLLANDPVGHAKRTLFLKHLHNAMVNLNQKVVHAAERRDEDGLDIQQSSILSDYELVKLSLAEEEKTAKEQGLVYANVIKNRIAAYKKMELKEWLKQRRDSLSPLKRISPEANGHVEKPVVTGLKHAEEIKVLEMLIVQDQTSLSAYGYISSPPSAAEAKEAALAVEKSGNYELCERCTARFQVFPSRNEEGLLTGQGRCRYHPRRKINPPRTRADTGIKEPFHPCCSEPTGSTGCAENDHHVFKASAPARLAAVLPFMMTPENPGPARDKSGDIVNAVAFDCEMGYTTLGLELIRLTALSWPYGETLVDVLVRPLGIVLDLNSRFSGVFPEHFLSALPYSSWVESVKAHPGSSPSKITEPHVPALPIVDNPQAARALLCSFLTPQTPLIGHAIENDLNAVRLCHPSIVDTILLFPHRRGLPMRLGLRALAEQHLGRAIQQSSKHGHDSSEDAKATADLVRVAIRERWKVMSAQGWSFEGEELIPPSPSSHHKAQSMSLSTKERGGGKKRARDEISTDDETSGREEAILRK
nr:rna exonuclease 3 [Quercus suber]